MINLLLNYIFTEINTLTSTLCSGLVLPLIYFTNPLSTTLTEQLKQVTVEDNKYNPQISLLSNLSKGISAYDAGLQKEREEASKESIQQLTEDLLIGAEAYASSVYTDYLANKEEYKAELSNKLYRRRLCRSRKARFQAKKMSKLSLFNKYHPGGKS